MALIKKKESNESLYLLMNVTFFLRKTHLIGLNGHLKQKRYMTYGMLDGFELQTQRGLMDLGSNKCQLYQFGI